MVITDAYRNFSDTKALFFMAIDASTGTTLSEYGEIYSSSAGSMSDILWETNPASIQFYIADGLNREDYYHITMQLDGSVLKEVVTEAEFQAYYTSRTLMVENRDDVYIGQGLSPTRNFAIMRNYPQILVDQRTGEEFQLPIHSQGTICRKYTWSESENYILMSIGTAATDGCGPAVIGVTDQRGELWRELGGCTLWEATCSNWLPPQVDINTLRAGQLEPVQLDPVAYETEEVLNSVYALDGSKRKFRLLCRDNELQIVGENEPEQVLYRLNWNICTYPETGLIVTFAYEPDHHLLATYVERSLERFVTIWSTRTTPATPILRLNTLGFELEFTPDGTQLRARNVNAWKIYDVASILAYAERND